MNLLYYTRTHTHTRMHTIPYEYVNVRSHTNKSFRMSSNAATYTCTYTHTYLAAVHGMPEAELLTHGTNVSVRHHAVVTHRWEHSFINSLIHSFTHTHTHTHTYIHMLMYAYIYTTHTRVFVIVTWPHLCCAHTCMYARAIHMRRFTNSHLCTWNVSLNHTHTHTHTYIRHPFKRRHACIFTYMFMYTGTHILAATGSILDHYPFIPVAP